MGVVTVPETTMNKDHLAAARESQVGMSGKRARMKSVSVAEGVD